MRNLHTLRFECVEVVHGGQFVQNRACCGKHDQEFAAYGTYVRIRHQLSVNVQPSKVSGD